MRRTDSLERHWCWERLTAEGEGDDRGWDGWMASSTWSTWVWASSRSWWWTGKPGMLQSMGSQRVGHKWATELNWKEISPEYSLEGLMLKLQYFGHLMWRTDFLIKDPDAGKDWRQEEKEMTEDKTRWTWVWTSSRSWWWTGKPGVLQSMVSQRVRHNWATELNWGCEDLVPNKECKIYH